MRKTCECNFGRYCCCLFCSWQRSWTYISQQDHGKKYLRDIISTDNVRWKHHLPLMAKELYNDGVDFWKMSRYYNKLGAGACSEFDDLLFSEIDIVFFLHWTLFSAFDCERNVCQDWSLSKYFRNKAGYTATPVACGWAGAIIEVTPSFGQEQWG